MKINKKRFFVEMFNYWCGRLGIPYIPSREDNRQTCHACIVENGKEMLYTKDLNKWSNAILIGSVFHEINHIQNKLPYDTKEEQIICEYIAENYAIVMLKLYYPKLLKIYCSHYKKRLKTEWWCEKYPLHKIAFEKIKEFKSK